MVQETGTLVGVIILLAATNLILLAAMLINSHLLLNKLMSRSYFDYVKTNEKPTKPIAKGPVLGEEFKLNLNQNDEINSLNELAKNLLPL